MFGFLGDNIDSVKQAADVRSAAAEGALGVLFRANCCMRCCRPTTWESRSLRKALGETKQSNPSLVPESEGSMHTHLMQ